MHFSPLIALVLLSGCAFHNSQSSWLVDGIEAGVKEFDSKRLRHISSNPDASLAYEMVKIGNETCAYLQLSQYKLKPTADQQVDALFLIGGDAFEESLLVHEGRMRIRLSPEIAERITLALQDGIKVSILVDGFEETLQPDQFAEAYNQFLGKGSFLQTLF